MTQLLFSFYRWRKGRNWGTGRLLCSVHTATKSQSQHLPVGSLTPEPRLCFTTVVFFIQLITTSSWQMWKLRLRGEIIWLSHTASKCQSQNWIPSFSLAAKHSHFHRRTVPPCSAVLHVALHVEHVGAGCHSPGCRDSLVPHLQVTWPELK